MKNNLFKKLSIVLFIVSYLIITIFVIFAKDSNNDGQRASFTFQKFELKNINIFINDFEKYLLDNVKYRDEIINFDIYLKKYFGLNYGDENINIVDTKNKTNFNNDFFLDENIATISQIENVAEVYNKLNNINFNIADVKNAANKVVIMGEKENVRAVNIFNGSYHTIDDVALRMNTISAILNTNEELADKKINMYYMLVPLTHAYYFPESIRGHWFDQRKLINMLKDKLSENIKFIDIYDELYKHRNEYIYFRTDSHWTQLGGYYAARVFCEVANLVLPDIKDYEERVINNFCGSFYKYTEDYRLKEYPDTFYYYVPRNFYTTNQRFYNYDSEEQKYTIYDKNNVDLFKRKNDGDDYIYMTFLGGDENTTRVFTENKNGRKLLIIKDSFGNAFSPNLVPAVEELHIVDFRYMKENLVEYIKENDITDILFESQLAMFTDESIKYLTLFTQDVIKK